MKAKIESLSGKYYGTRVTLENGEGITVWLMGDFKPSNRQLEDWEMTLEEAKADDMMCDSHYETELCYQVAESIVKALAESESE